MSSHEHDHVTAIVILSYLFVLLATYLTFYCSLVKIIQVLILLRVGMVI